MGVPVSLLVIAVGAILAFAVDHHSPTVNIVAVGWILMAAGLVGLVLSLVIWDSWVGGGFWSNRAARGPRRPPPP